MTKAPNPTPNKTTRADDERLLEAVRIRSAGGTGLEAGLVMGKPKEYARAATNRVKGDDASYSGEDVSKFYW